MCEACTTDVNGIDCDQGAMTREDWLHRRLTRLFPFQSVSRAAWRASPLELICLERMINRALEISEENETLEMREVHSVEFEEGRVAKLFFPAFRASLAIVVGEHESMVLDFAFESELATRQEMTEMRRFDLG